MMTATLIPDIDTLAERVRATYFIEPRRMERAVQLYKAHKLRKLVKPESMWYVSSEQAPHGHWTVDDDKLTCDCPDAVKHNTPDVPGVFICKHVAAVLLHLKIQAETARHGSEASSTPNTASTASTSATAMTFEEMIEHLFGTPLIQPKAKSKTDDTSAGETK